MGPVTPEESRSALRRAARVALLIAALLPAAPLAAQQAAGDSAWTAGDFATARASYQRALQENPALVRALFRLAVLASWDGQLDSALTLLSRARAAEPADPDVRLHQAKVLSWAGRQEAALLQYDSLLADHPELREAAHGRADVLSWIGRYREADAAYAALLAGDSADVPALTGRGRVAAWQGDLAAAGVHYRAALARDPRFVPALVGLAQVRLWQGRPAEARRYALAAQAVAPEDRGARDVLAGVRTAVRPRLEIALGWSRDSDRNRAWWQTVAGSLVLGSGLRGFASAGAAEMSDPLQDASRMHGEAGLTWYAGRGSLTAALGVRRLHPSPGADRSLATWRAGATWRFSPRGGAGIGYARSSLDETAFLIGQGPDLDELSFDADLSPARDLTVALGGGVGWFSDGNARRSAVVSVSRRLAGRWTAGLFGRHLGYDRRGTGYFSPDRFLLGELRGAFTAGGGAGPWEGRLSGGVGLQQVGRGGATQSEWHGEGRLARRWGAINELALSGGVSTSAESSTTGAWRYTTAALTLRLGL